MAQQPGASSQQRVQDQLQHMYDCCICYELLLDPIVGLCGHDACRGCLERWVASQKQSQQHHEQQPTGVRCPVCRGCFAESSSDRLPGVCLRLRDTLELLYPERLAARRQEAAQHTALLRKRAAKRAAPGTSTRQQQRAAGAAPGRRAAGQDAGAPSRRFVEVRRTRQRALQQQQAAAAPAVLPGSHMQQQQQQQQGHPPQWQQQGQPPQWQQQQPQTQATTTVWGGLVAALSPISPPSVAAAAPPPPPPTPVWVPAPVCFTMGWYEPSSAPRKRRARGVARS